MLVGYLLTNAACSVNIPEEEVQPVDSWVCADMGAGGWFNGIEAGPDGTIILNSDLSGSYMSKDRGESWVCIGESRGLKATHTCGIGFDPNNGDVIFIGTDKGIFRSADGGETFEKVRNGGFCTDIAISKTDSQIGYAALTSSYSSHDGKVYKTTDGGSTWRQVSVDLPESGVMIQELYINPENPDEVYAHSYNGRFVSDVTSRLYKSVDGGISWTELGVDDLSGNIFDFDVDESDFDTVYASTRGENNTGTMLKSTDGGKTWDVISENVWGAVHLKTDDPRVIRVIGASYYHVSEDAGATWETSAIDGAMFYPGHSYNNPGDTRKCDDMSNPDVIFWKNVAWAWMSKDGGKTVEPLWTDESSDEDSFFKGRGIQNTNCKDISISPVNSDIVYAAFLDMGLWRSLDGGETWQSCNSSDVTTWPVMKSDTTMTVGGMSDAVAADPERENVVWAGRRYGLYKSENKGSFDSWVECGLTKDEDSKARVRSIAFFGSISDGTRIMYLAYNGKIHKSTDDGISFEELPSSDGIKLSYVTVDQLTGTIYAGDDTADTGKLYRWNGTAFEDISGEGMRSIQEITTDPVSPGTIYVACYGKGRGLYMSSDSGENWTQLLTDNHLRGVSVNPQNPLNIFAASSYPTGSGGYRIDSTGVLVTYDGGKTWSESNEGLAWRTVGRIRFDPNNSNIVYAATYGLGVQKRQYSAK